MPLFQMWYVSLYDSMTYAAVCLTLPLTLIWRYVPFHGGVAYAESLDGRNWLKPSLELEVLQVVFLTLTLTLTLTLGEGCRVY